MGRCLDYRRFLQALFIKLFIKGFKEKSPERELTPLQKRLNAMTLEEQIQYLFYSKERDDDDDTMDNPT